MWVGGGLEGRPLTPLDPSLLCSSSGNASGSCSSRSPLASHSAGSTSGGKSAMTTTNSTGEWGRGGHGTGPDGGLGVSLSPRLALRALLPARSLWPWEGQSLAGAEASWEEQGTPSWGGCPGK